jgi:hypothetical protein
MLAMLHDIRRVVQQQGWPRLDIAVDIAGAGRRDAQGGRQRPGDLQGLGERDDRRDEEAYRCLQPDDAFTPPALSPSIARSARSMRPAWARSMA